MIGAIALLIACEVAGEALRRLGGLPLPASVLGMLVLLGWLACLPRPRPQLEATTRWLTAHLSILFVPAAVGVMQQGPLLARYGLGLAVATAGSTLLTLIVTVLVFRWALRGAETAGAMPRGKERLA